MVAKQANKEPVDILDNNSRAEEPVVPTIQDVHQDSPELKKANISANISEEKVANIGIEAVSRPHMQAAYAGWKQIGGWTEKDSLTPEDELVDLNRETILDNVLPDSLYGDWYHFVIILFVAGVLSFTLGYFKFTLAPVFFVIFITGLAYRTNAKKYRASIRDLIQKELTVQKIEDDYETIDWLNNLLDKYWIIIEPTVSQMVATQVNDILATEPSIPPFIKAIWLHKFTLGIKPPRIDVVKTFQNTASDIVVMDWNVSFTPHDLSDMTAKQVKNYVNEKVVVKAKLFGFTIPVSVSDIAFKAQTRVRFKLMTPFPHVETVNIQLLDVPDIDFLARVFGDNVFNWEVLSIPGLYTLIKIMAKKYMGPMLLPPFSFQLNIPQLLSNSNLSIGVLEVTIKKAVDIKRSNTIVSTSVDPYITFELSGKSVGKTRTVRDTLNPVWNETLYLLLSSFTDPLTITLFDKRETLKDKVMGRIEYNLNSMHDKDVQKDIKSHFLRNSKPVGDLLFDLRFFPTLDREVLPSGEVKELPELNSGIAKVVVEELHGLNEENKKASYYIELFLNAKLVLTTKKVINVDILKYNENYESVISDRRKSRYRFVIKDSKTNEVVASMVQSLNDLIDRTIISKPTIPLPNTAAHLKVTTHWKPVRLDLGVNSIAYTPPIGLVRIYLRRANNLKNLENIGKIDPYAKVLVNGLSKGRTDYKSQTLNPVWNLPIYVAVSSPNQKVSIEVMDVETINKDRRVGIYDLDLSYMFEKDQNDRYTVHVGEEDKKVLLFDNKGPSGELIYNASFYPILPVLTLEEQQDYEKAQKKKLELEERKKTIDEKKITAAEKEKLTIEELEIEEIQTMFSSKQKLSLDELITYNSGVLAISVLNGELPETNLYVQAFFDGNGHSRFTSPQISGRIIKDGWTGDVAIKELKRSLSTFRVTDNKEGNRVEKCHCEVTIPTIELVKNCYNKPSIITLDGESTAKLMVQISWFPLDVKELPASDLMSNSGDLTIISKSAENLMASDSNGFSDPFLKFYIDDFSEVIHKTQVVKKTLNPVWNNTGKVEISDRANTTLNIKVMDWDATSSDDIIGRAKIPLSSIVPNKSTTLDIPVKRDDGGDGGMLHMEFKFEPRYVITASKREKKIGDVASKGIGGGLKAGSTVVSAGVGTIGKIGKGVFGAVGIGKKSSKNKKTDDEN